MAPPPPPPPPIKIFASRVGTGGGAGHPAARSGVFFIVAHDSSIVASSGAVPSPLAGPPRLA